MTKSEERRPLIVDEGEAVYGEEHWAVASLRRAGAEALGTFLLMFAACGTVMGGWEMMGQAMAVGFCLVGLISSLGPLSGAHFNPAITLAFCATRRFAWSQVPLYAASQLVGGTLAVALAKLLFGLQGTAVALTLPSSGWAQSFFMEIVLTFTLALVATAMNDLPKIDGIQGGVAVGLTVAMNMLLGGDLSGASMNPIRSLAPAIIQNSYTYIWIYVLAPIIGAILGALSYTTLKMDSKLYQN